MCFKSRPVLCGWTCRMVPVWALWCLDNRTRDLLCVSLRSHSVIMKAFLWKSEIIWICICYDQSLHRRCRLLAVIICFALDIVTTEVCRCDPHTQDFQALTGVPGHAVLENQSGGGPIFILALVAVLFVCLQQKETQDRLLILLLKAPPAHNCCGVTRAVLYAALWLFWFGEEKAEPWTPSWQLSSNQRSPASRRETAATVHRLCRVFVLA